MGITAKSTAQIRFPRQQTLPPTGHYTIHRDARDGAVDYDAALPPSPVPAWRDAEGKTGFGLGVGGFGEDAFGLGGGAGHAGFGLAPFGESPFGFDNELVTEHQPFTPDGRWTFGVLAVDPAGNISPVGDEDDVRLAAAPAAAQSLKATAYAADGDVLALAIGLSPDDEGA